MNRSLKSSLGVTLLEIMLVLAIAAMVIVMSIRYYQSASTNQKINTTVNNVTGIIAAAESFLQSKGTFTGMKDADIMPYLPGGVMPNSGWGGAMSVTGESDVSYTIKMPKPPTDGCSRLTSLMGAGGTGAKNVSINSDCTTITVGGG